MFRFRRKFVNFKLDSLNVIPKERILSVITLPRHFRRYQLLAVVIFFNKFDF